jgi:hypothetical protein
VRGVKKNYKLHLPSRAMKKFVIGIGDCRRSNSDYRPSVDVSSPIDRLKYRACNRQAAMRDAPPIENRSRYRYELEHAGFLTVNLEPSNETTPKWHGFSFDQTGRFSGQRQG